MSNNRYSKLLTPELPLPNTVVNQTTAADIYDENESSVLLKVILSVAQTSEVSEKKIVDFQNYQNFL